MKDASTLWYLINWSKKQTSWNSADDTSPSICKKQKQKLDLIYVRILHKKKKLGQNTEMLYVLVSSLWSSQADLNTLFQVDLTTPRYMSERFEACATRAFVHQTDHWAFLYRNRINNVRRSDIRLAFIDECDGYTPYPVHLLGLRLDLPFLSHLIWS